jgi:hypothetical protein
MTVSNAVRGYGVTNPVFSGTLAGLQNGDDITATYATPAVTNSPAGTYPIIPILVDPNGRLVNYTVTTNIGTLTVINIAPSFNLSPFTEPAIVAGQNYVANIATNATDANGETPQFSLASGPNWLSLSAAGDLSGEPLSANVGTNSFVVSVTDLGGLTNTATLDITILPAAPILSSVIGGATNLWVSWSGGIPPFQVQMSTDLTTSNWISIGGSVTSNTVNLFPSNPAAFYRIVGQ